MASPGDIQQCEYLRAASLPHTFASERAELGYITERIRSLDHHISQLTTLRRVLHHRSCQLHNLFSPISVLPVEVLSCIFRRFVNRGHDSDSRFYKERLGRALVLSSVSSLFRQVAFRTSQLWMGIPLNLPTAKAVGHASSLLQHCITRAPCVGISLVDKLTEVEARLAAEILLTSDVTRKVKSFKLSLSKHASHVWIEKLKSSSSPILDSLKIEDPKRDLIYDFRMFEALTQLNINGYCLDRSIIMPPSLQRLDIWDVTRQALISFLSQCPNLVECVVRFGHEIIDDLDVTNFIDLNHLNRLTLVDAAETNSLAKSLRLPSLETLKLCPTHQSKIISALPLCYNVSNTITTLNITVPFPDALDCDGLYQLCRLSFPKLEELFLLLRYSQSFLSVIPTLALLDRENKNPETRHLSALKSITLRTLGFVEWHILRDSLKEYSIGEALPVCIQIGSNATSQRDYTPALQEELKLIVRGRRVEITWG